MQQANLRRHLSAADAAAEGFVTAEYELLFLEHLHQHTPSVVALQQQLVVGYALVAPPAASLQHPLLAGLIAAVEQSEYQQQKITRAQYIMVGQLCVAKGWPGHGLVAAMYQYFRQQYAQQFLYCCTDVSVQNEPSLKAPHRCGFQDMHTLQYGGKARRMVL